MECKDVVLKLHSKVAITTHLNYGSHSSSSSSRGGDIGGAGGAQAVPLFRLGGLSPPNFSTSCTENYNIIQEQGYTALHCHQFGPWLSHDSVQQSNPSPNPNPMRLSVQFALMRPNYVQPRAPPPQLNIQIMSPPPPHFLVAVSTSGFYFFLYT